ncbi:hypothetical protein JoomaDRAFT_3536 [Galbibacter orientalis DSM 19592]|uniref:Uncharacterized protein n=1 Tax=Galbibacter orientalis DSM 19592 TaxID=926559 RepID=I3CA32_9FLAO|nr:hypothetical protein [Galbibacter orientalis]EIJ40475.1 hypothetical protein JoomaDRAFT_3536 [Galbibacter orientalis DSM 19592]|tara:strand:- start:87 stop:803 length:717 start_codon:yes stop_codon:yes gene_type:complete
MMLKTTNIEEKLQSYRNKTSNEENILLQVHSILQKDATHIAQIKSNLAATTKKNNAFKIDLLDANKVYHISQIKKICIDYRLRFLSSKYFKGQIPQEAISAIKELEKLHQTTINGHQIIAPSKLFKLENADDPLLFAPIGNDYYYLIYKWGNDLHPLRKLAVMPFKNLFNLIILILGLSFVVAKLIPMELFTREKSSVYFLVLYFFIFKMIASITLFYGVALGKNFNNVIWKNKYFNA